MAQHPKLEDSKAAAEQSAHYRPADGCAPTRRHLAACAEPQLAIRITRRLRPTRRGGRPRRKRQVVHFFATIAGRHKGGVNNARRRLNATPARPKSNQRPAHAMMGAEGALLQIGKRPPAGRPPSAGAGLSHGRARPCRSARRPDCTQSINEAKCLHGARVGRGKRIAPGSASKMGAKRARRLVGRSAPLPRRCQSWRRPSWRARVRLRYAEVAPPQSFAAAVGLSRHRLGIFGLPEPRRRATIFVRTLSGAPSGRSLGRARPGREAQTARDGRRRQAAPTVSSPTRDF
jgi:hypothetical protein